MTDTSTDFTRNKQLAMFAKMSLSHARSQRLLQNMLLDPGYNQEQANHVVKIVEACASIANVDTSTPGDWDALAHGIAMYLAEYRLNWLYHKSGFVDPDNGEDPYAITQQVFGNRFAGNDVIKQLDNYGDPMVVEASDI